MVGWWMVAKCWGPTALATATATATWPTAFALAIACYFALSYEIRGLKRIARMQWRCNDDAP